MPCNTITTVKLELKNASFDLLKKAVGHVMGSTEFYERNKILYWNGGSYDKLTGTLEVRNERWGKEIKQRYSGEVVKAQASRFGWQCKQVAENKFEIIKR